MNCQYNLLLLFLCGFAALSVSTEECGKDLLVGTSCIIKRTSRNKEKPPEIKWVHDLNGNILRWKGGTVRGTYAGASMEEDGSLKMSKVSLKDTGKYKFYEFNADGAEIGTREVEIKVYEKAPKPTVSIRCTKDGNATLSCEIGNRKDLTVTWYKDKMIQNDKKTQVLLSFTQVQENKPYSCEAQNPVSKDKSESITVSCSGPGSGYGKLFGFDFWVMLGILAGGGALLLLLICVLIICACRSCRQRTKRQQDEEELRLEGLTPGQNGTSRSKQTARGQPAPPVPQEDSILCSPSPETPRSQTQPKAQIRARPPPPPQDEEDPPPLPQPRNKQHRNKRSQEPYRPME